MVMEIGFYLSLILLVVSVIMIFLDASEEPRYLRYSAPMLVAALALTAFFLVRIEDKEEQNKTLQVTSEWINEETRCHFQDDKIINCETVRPYRWSKC